MLQVIGIAFATLICSLMLKDKVPSFSVLITVIGACIILGFIAENILVINNTISTITSYIGSSVDYIKIMVKVLLISILTQLLSDVCRDNGQNAVASMTEIAAKIIIVTLVLPLFETIITIIIGLVK